MEFLLHGGMVNLNFGLPLRTLLITIKQSVIMVYQTYTKKTMLIADIQFIRSEKLYMKT